MPKLTEMDALLYDCVGKNFQRVASTKTLNVLSRGDQNNLSEHGFITVLMQDIGRLLSIRTTTLEEGVLDAEDRNLGFSVRALVPTQDNLNKRMRCSALHSFHFQKVQLL
ncbi:hypothetical protein NPIL_99661 [Nephila pilipes]|uniref:Uncharacterized protein n=1 Tax=Nephila pilipes TaxID=299642 RepID=A0A8X6PJU9_NEPPI|nr:hypothetical protein NPIL_99661 [Nephila pilipes]